MNEFDDPSSEEGERDYQLVYASHDNRSLEEVLETLEYDVNDKLQYGWRPLGGPFVMTDDKQGRKILVQPMIADSYYDEDSELE